MNFSEEFEQINISLSFINFLLLTARETVLVKPLISLILKLPSSLPLALPLDSITIILPLWNTHKGCSLSHINSLGFLKNYSYLSLQYTASSVIWFGSGGFIQNVIFMNLHWKCKPTGEISFVNIYTGVLDS